LIVAMIAVIALAAAVKPEMASASTRSISDLI
jgi:hypothetical protein